MEVDFVRGFDSLFAESLTKANMASYYQARGIVWDHNQFLRSWDKLDNYEVYADGNRVGVVRFSYSENSTFLRDLQLVSESQGKGIGSICLDLVRNHAMTQNSKSLVLRVFSENPAINLYESKGFIKTFEIKGLAEMELLLGSNT
ncbi:GNAT family N-acetyltransferase [Vibrio proteolyticus]